jgi:hypothetical protein
VLIRRKEGGIRKQGHSIKFEYTHFAWFTVWSVYKGVRFSDCYAWLHVCHPVALSTKLLVKSLESSKSFPRLYKYIWSRVKCIALGV